MKPFRMRFLAASAVSLATNALALSAQALPLDLAALPSAPRFDPPARKAAPRFIPASEVVPGLVRLSIDKLFNRRVPGFRETAIFDDVTRAQEFKRQMSGNGEPPFRRSSTCFATPSNFRVPEEHDSRGLDWDVMSADRFTAQTYPGDRGSKVVPYRAERWIEAAGGSVKLETTRFWVDLGTGGTRLLDRTTTDLARVAAPFAGVGVYAQRSGDDSVSFFVRRDLPDPSTTPFDPRALTRFSFGPSEGMGVDLTTLRTVVSEEVRNTECAFEHVQLTLQPDASFEAVAAAVPAADSAAHPGSAKAAPSFLTNRSSEIASVAFNVVTELEAEPAAAEPAADAPAQPDVRGTASVRTIVVNVGIVRGAVGSLPVPSVSYGWADRARTRSF